MHIASPNGRFMALTLPHDYRHPKNLGKEVPVAAKASSPAPSGPVTLGFRVLSDTI